MSDQIGKMVTFTIDNIAVGGDGVGRLQDGRVCFVDRGFPGETVDAVITEEKKSFSRARLTRVITPKFQEDIPCPVADDCGGCRFWGAPYAQELQWKFGAAESAMKRIGGEVPWPAFGTIGAPSPEDYRSRAELRIDHSGAIGYRKPKSDEMVPTDACPVLYPPLEKALESMGAIGARYGASSAFIEWDEIREHVVVEYHMGDTVDPDVELRSTDIAMCKEAHIGSVIFRPEQRTQVVYGDGRVHRKIWLDDQNYMVSNEQHGQFAQAHRAMNHALVQKVHALADGGAGSRIVDLFSGAGNLSLGIWARGADLVLMDVAGPAIQTAKQTIAKAQQEEGANERTPRTVEVNLHRPPRRIHELVDWADTLIVNPPRGGVSKSLRRILGDSNARRMVYVSCDPPALARDVQSMVAKGWNVGSTDFMDLYPRTPHVEAVCLLTQTDT